MSTDNQKHTDLYTQTSMHKLHTNIYADTSTQHTYTHIHMHTHMISCSSQQSYVDGGGQHGIYVLYRNVKRFSRGRQPPAPSVRLSALSLSAPPPSEDLKVNIALQKDLFPGGPGRVLARDHTYPHALGFQLRACPSGRGHPPAPWLPVGTRQPRTSERLVSAPACLSWGLSLVLFPPAAWRGSGVPLGAYTQTPGEVPAPVGAAGGGQGFSELPVIPEIPTEAHLLCTCRPSLSGSWAQSPHTQGLLEDGAHLESLPPGRRTYKPRSKDPQEGLRSSGGDDSRTCRPLAQDALPTAAQTCSLPRGYWCGEAHAEDRVWGQEGPQGTGHWVLHTPDCIQGSSDAQRWLFEAGPGFLRLPEEQSPFSRATNHLVGESQQAPPHGKRAGWVQGLDGGRLRPSHLQASGHSP